MNHRQAHIKLTKLLGKTAGARIDPGAPTAEQRAAIAARRPALQTAYTEAKAAMEARRAELLKDPEYVRLTAAYQAARKERDDATCDAFRQRITAGRVGKMFFSVLATGDTWEEVFTELERKRQAGTLT